MSTEAPPAPPHQSYGVQMADPTEPDDVPSASAMPAVVRVTTIDLTGIGEALDRARQTFTGDRRRGIGEKLTVLVAVLKVTDPDMRRGHREMMAALLTALVDLDRGKEPELLAKNKVEHRPLGRFRHRRQGRRRDLAAGLPRGVLADRGGPEAGAHPCRGVGR